MIGHVGVKHCTELIGASRLELRESASRAGRADAPDGTNARLACANGWYEGTWVVDSGAW